VPNQTAERFSHQSACETFLQFRPTLFFGVPTMYVRMLEWESAHARGIGAFMRLFVSGSAPLSPAVLDGFEALLHHRMLERYGMSETLRIKVIPTSASDAPVRWGCLYLESGAVAGFEREAGTRWRNG
jgi:acyl-CoA synthetase (AMP-forming)/AMP-acid ligase II